MKKLFSVLLLIAFTSAIIPAFAVPPPPHGGHGIHAGAHYRTHMPPPPPPRATYLYSERSIRGFGFFGDFGSSGYRCRSCCNTIGYYNNCCCGGTSTGFYLNF